MTTKYLEIGLLRELLVSLGLADSIARAFNFYISLKLTNS